MTAPPSHERRPTPPGRAHVASRVLAALVGSYAFVWGVVAFGIAVGVRAMPYDEAQTLGYLLAFPVLLVGFCWAFAARSLMRVWSVLVGGGALLTLAAWLLTRSAT